LETGFTNISSPTVLGFANLWHPGTVSATSGTKNKLFETFYWTVSQGFQPATGNSEVVQDDCYLETRMPPDLEMEDVFEAERFLADVALGKAVIGVADMY
jgi:hypothetical protein